MSESTPLLSGSGPGTNTAAASEVGTHVAINAGPAGDDGTTSGGGENRAADVEDPVSIQIFVAGVVLWALCNFIGAVQSIIAVEGQFYNYTFANDDYECQFFLSDAVKSGFYAESIFLATTNGIVVVMAFLVATGSLETSQGNHVSTPRKTWTFTEGLALMSLALISTSFGTVREWLRHDFDHASDLCRAERLRNHHVFDCVSSSCVCP